MTTTTWIYRDDDDATPQAIELRQVETLRFPGLTVPVWLETEDPRTPFVRYEDLPVDLTEAFRQWQNRTAATMPYTRAAFAYDFEIFMRRGRA
jgi:hypothetical protein